MKPPEERTDSGGIPVEVDQFVLQGGNVRFIDRVPVEPFETTLHPIDVTVRHFRTEKGSKAEFALAVATEIAETVKAEGAFSLDPPTVEGTAAVTDVFPGKYFPYVRERLSFSWEKGKVDASTRFRYRDEPPVPVATLSDLAVTFRDLSLVEQGEVRPFIEIPEFAVRAVEADLFRREIAVGEVVSRGGSVLLKRLRDGSLNMSHLVATPEKEVEKTSESSAPGAKSEDAGATVPRVSLTALAVEGYHVVFEDGGIQTPATIDLRDLRFSGEGLSTVPGKKGHIALAFQDPDGGTVSVDGALGIDPLDFQAKVVVNEMALYPFQPYVQESLNLLLTDGTLSVDGAAGVRKKAGAPPAVTFAGSVRARDFSSAEGRHGEELVRFNALDVNGMNLSLEPNVLKIKEIRGSDFYVRLVIRPDKSINILDVVKKTEKGGAKEEKPPQAVPEVKEEKPFFERVAIDRLTLEKGRIDFTDRHVTPAFTANLYDMEGTVSGLLSDEASRAEVRFNGTYEKVIPLTIEGKVNPLGKDLYVDLKMIFQNVDLSPLTPYGRKYLGFPVDKGKLFLNLKYHIENNKLEAQNVVLVDQFTLGEPVESPDALSLPIKLAIALLKDRQGKIDLDIPLSGRTDDPEFSIFSIVLQVLGNMIVKAVTAPFALLGAIFGGGDELGYVEFDPGKTELNEEARKKLDVLTKALFDRPLLKLEMTGHVDPEKDREALREARLADRMKAEKVKELVRKGRKAPPSGELTVDPREYERYLMEVYQEAVPAEKRKGIKEKELSSADRKKIVLENLEISDGDLRTLAYDRTARVRDFLLSGGKVEKERLFLMEPRELAPKGKSGVRDSRVDFTLTN